MSNKILADTASAVQSGTTVTASDLMGVLHKRYANHWATGIETTGGNPIGSKFPAARLADWIEGNSGKRNCYLSAAQINPGVGLKNKYPKEDMVAAAALWVDIDPEGGDRFEQSRAETLAALLAYHLSLRASSIAATAIRLVVLGRALVLGDLSEPITSNAAMSISANVFATVTSAGTLTIYADA